MSFKIAVTIVVLAMLGEALSQEISTNDCNVTKGCYRQPADCKSSSDCDFLVTFAVQKGVASFEVSVKGATQWVALGLNNDAKMHNAAGEICLDQATRAEIKGFENTANPYGDPTLYTVQAQDSTVINSLVEVNGALICRFSRTVKSSAKYQFVLDRPYHLIVAGGKALKPDGAPAYHTANGRVASQKKFDVLFAAPVASASSVAPSVLPSVQPSVPASVQPSATPAMTSVSSSTTQLSASATTTVNTAPSSHAVPSAEPTASSHYPRVTPSAEPTGNTTVTPTTKDHGNGASFTAPTIFTIFASLLLAKLSIC